MRGVFVITAIRVLLALVVLFNVAVLVCCWLDERMGSFPAEDWLADQPTEVLTDDEVSRRFEALTGWYR